MNNQGLVLLNKRTGDLYVGYKVSLLGSISDEYKISGNNYSIALASHDGWILQHPRFGQFLIFFNREVENMFEVLGEL